MIQIALHEYFTKISLIALKMEASVYSCLHRFHVYQDMWTPIMGVF